MLAVAGILVVAMIVMAIVPSREQLTKELAEKTARCGHVANDRICLRPKQHTNDHEYENIERTVPFE